MKIGVCSDIFLDLSSKKSHNEFFKHIKDNEVEHLIVCGNLFNSTNYKEVIDLLSKKVKNTYFVLGNHDYWYSSFEVMQKNVTEHTKKIKNVHYLQNSDVIEISDDTCIVGVDGWADLLQEGKMISSFMIMNEWENIKDFTPNKVFSTARKKSFDDSLLLEKKLKTVDKKYQNIVIATHYPPWSELVGFNSTEMLLIPYYTNKSIKNVITNISKDKSVYVFCGHTHEEKVYEVDNIKSYCCKSSYRKPIVSNIFEL